MSCNIQCAYCKRDNFKSRRALSQHLSKNDECRAAMEGHMDRLHEHNQVSGNDFLQFSAVSRQHSRYKYVREGVRQRDRSNILGVNGFPLSLDEYMDSYHNGFRGNDEDDVDFALDDNLSSDDEWNGVEDDYEHSFAVIDDLNCNYESFLNKFGTTIGWTLEPSQMVSIDLLFIIRKTNAPLCLYEEIMRWYLLHTGKIYPHQKLGESPDYFSRANLYKSLNLRYNVLPNKYNIRKDILLPGSLSRANVYINDAATMFQSLLTDPRIRDDDYLFFDDNPFSPPPPVSRMSNLSDINTGDVYRSTYQRLISKSPGTKQVLLPVIFYIDGSATGQFVDLKITAVKFTFGIFKREARDKPYLWRTLGYVPDVSKSFKSRGKRIFVDSNHMDAECCRLSTHSNEGRKKVSSGLKNMQDFHAILAVILESMIPLQTNGFCWNFYYKGRLYDGVEFVPFVPFICCDTEEANRLCGSYISGGKQICRYCLCPRSQSDSPYLSYIPKTYKMVNDLISEGNMLELKRISQHNLVNNATHLLRFGLHDNSGVHGATPMEMLHAILLGIFMYVRDCFFEQTGSSEYSSLGSKMNSLCTQYGQLLSRQSDRDLPKTKFSKGIQRGKLQGKEFSGIMLVLLAAMYSSEGRNCLVPKSRSKSKDDKFPNSERYSKWIMLLNKLLQWESWLKSRELLRSDVLRSKQKLRYLMYLIKSIGNRQEGNGWKIIKFHGIVHMTDDILKFGVPSNFDTGPMEAGHKPTKRAAKATQKNEDTFDEQTSQRLLETHLLDLAMEEKLGRPLWKYRSGYQHSNNAVDAAEDPYIAGAQFTVEFSDRLNKYVMSLFSACKRNTVIYVEQDFVNFVANLQNKVKEWCNALVVKTSHHRNGCIFRSSPSYRGGVWRDWVIIDWGDYKCPCRIWGFVDLTFLPEVNDVNHGGYSPIIPAVYAIVEHTGLSGSRSHGRYDIFRRIHTEVRRVRNSHVVLGLKLYLADVEAFVDPAVVVADIGGPPNCYLHLRPRCDWDVEFSNWLRTPYEGIPESELQGRDLDGSEIFDDEEVEYPTESEVEVDVEEDSSQASTIDSNS